MRPRRRTVALAALAICVPLPAWAMSGGGSAPAAGTLGVSASLDSCGIAGSSVVCKIDAGWSSVEGASSYSASVTSPDGSVVDHGDVGGSGTSFWVPYVGPGTYTVTVSAYGNPPGADKRELIAKDNSEGQHENPLDDEGTTSLEATVGEDADGDGVPDGEEPTDEEPVEEPEPCEEPEEEPPAEASSGNEGEQSELSTEEQAALEAEAELPDEIDCPGE